MEFKANLHSDLIVNKCYRMYACLAESLES